MSTLTNIINIPTNIFDNCKYCVEHKTCKRHTSCKYLSPSADTDYCNQIMDRLRKNNIPSEDKHLRPVLLDLLLNNNENSDDTFATYEFYRKMINESLDNIRNGLTTYVYNEQCIAEILRFETDINVTYRDGIFYINKLNN